jgi:hypothetical protein
MIVDLKNNCKLKYPSELKKHQLNLRRMINWIIRKIKLHNATLCLTFYYDDSEDFGGVCLPHYNQKNTYDILLNIYYLDNATFPIMLLHELTHAKQIQNGVLVIKRKLNGVFWKGVFYCYNDFGDFPERKHRLLPWEKPAYQAEKKSLPKYFSKIKIITEVKAIFLNSKKIKMKDLCLIP